MTTRNDFSDAPIVRPPRKIAPARYRDRLDELFQAWGAVMGRNRVLSLYYRMHNSLKDLGISIPEDLLDVNCTVGWCEKAIKTRAVRSNFDGFVFNGATDGSLNALVSANRMRSLYDKAVRSTLVHGISAFTVMRGGDGQPAVKVRAYSGTQFSVLWDKDADRISCGIVLADVDKDGAPSKYVAHFGDAVLTFDRSGADWACEAEPNPMGRPMMEVLAFDPDLDRPLGHSMLTPEVLGIVDKAMRDVLRMEVGAEFFTFPQRYVIGAAEDLFSTAPDGCEQNEDGEFVDAKGNVIQPVVSEVAKFKAYIGAILAISRDENGDVPTVGQFTPSSADNFTRMFENDAQRFSGATDVPLGQLGVMSNTYTSSEALGAANNPLIISVEEMNRQFAGTMEEVARMMLAVQLGLPMAQLPPEKREVSAVFADPSMPTISARADAWTKLGAADPSIVGTRVYYENIGLDQATIDRLEAEKRKNGAIASLNRIASAMPPGGELQ